LFSIVTVVKNNAEGLKETIESVINQVYKDYEYILICGESEDKTYDVIDKYKKHFTKYIIEKDEGIYFAMNKGLLHCKGHYINFLNAGDTFYSEKTLQFINEMIEDSTDIFSGSINSISTTGVKKLKSWKEQYHPDQYMFCFHQTMFARKDIFKSIKFNTIYDVCADYDWTLQCYFNNYKFQYVDEPLVNFQEGGFSEKNRVKARIEELFIQSKYFKCNEGSLDKNALSKLLLYRKSNNFMLPKMLDKANKQINFLKNKNKVYSLYGYGSFCKYIIDNKFLKFENIFDINYKKINKSDHKLLIKNPSMLSNNTKANIVITALGHESEIEKFLLSKGINSRNIYKFEL